MLKNLADRLKKFFSQHLTLMVVPHSTLRQFQFRCSLSFAIFLTFLWTGLTSWAAMAVVGNLDYWTIRVSHEALKLKVQYFAMELKKSREIIDQVREADLQLRNLLKMGNRQNIIEERPSKEGKGGPTGHERSLLLKTLHSKLWDITEHEIREESNTIQRESNEQIRSYKEISEHIAFERGKYRATPRGWPATGRMTSHFGSRISPLSGQADFHAGIDIANEKGTPVLSTADGTVQSAGWESGYGRLIVIDHGFGYSTAYGHNSILLVKKDDPVRKGQVIAYMGSSGSSTGSHTHYEVWLNGRCVNPWNYLYSRTARAQVNVGTAPNWALSPSRTARAQVSAKKLGGGL